MTTDAMTFGRVKVRVSETRDAMGKAAAQHVVGLLRRVLSRKETANVVFAAAPSQTEFLSHLAMAEDVDWSRILGFHMDEYIGLPADSDQFFGRYLERHIFSLVKFREVHLFDSQANDTSRECDRYAGLLRDNPIDIVCLGIGENGHIAFNDPPFADFQDPQLVKVIELDDRDRQQQVHDGCFKSVPDVPRNAYTLTIPALMSAKYLSCVVPTKRKATAVARALTGPLTTAVPASILRTHPRINIFLDVASASLLGPRRSDYR